MVYDPLDIIQQKKNKQIYIAMNPPNTGYWYTCRSS
jgi:hypothetical protein